jgi:hypothetical protein
MQMDRHTDTISPLYVQFMQFVQGIYNNCVFILCVNIVVCFRMLFRDFLHKKIGSGRSERTA